MKSHPPKMGALLQSPQAIPLRERYGETALKTALGRAVNEARRAWLDGSSLPDPEGLFRRAGVLLAGSFAPPLRRVINATGVLLHTNLGRAPLPPGALREAADLLSGYVDLEIDLREGARGHRDARLEEDLRDLLRTDRSLVVVNNNAAATMLMLNTLSAGKETIVSRGELVEIGGGFRMPEVMAASGALLREVGTTNRTRAEDYRKAAGPAAGLLLKVHTSNYRILGFTEEVDLEVLVELGRELSLPVAFDLGSGLAVDPAAVGLSEEPTVARALRCGPAALCFSSDKLFGACQAGLLLVAPELAGRFRGNPLLRALRVDKVAYCLLGAAISAYRMGRWREVPVLALMATPASALKARASRLRRLVESRAPGVFNTALVQAEGRVGGGSAPLAALSSPALALKPVRGSTERLESFLRTGGDPAVLCTIESDRVLIHVRTLLPRDSTDLVRRLAEFPKEPMP